MAVFNVPASNIQPGAERHGAAVDPPDQVTAAFVQLTDPNGVWNTTSGNIVRWGVQMSKPDGTFFNTAADWQNRGSVFQDGVPFGSRDRAGGMPALKIESEDQNGNPVSIAEPGVRVRLAIQTTGSAIVLGAVVKTNADA